MPLNDRKRKQASINYIINQCQFVNQALLGTDFPSANVYVIYLTRITYQNYQNSMKSAVVTNRDRFKP